MRVTLLLFCALIGLHSAVAANSEISQQRAHQLSTYYFGRYFPREGCGGVALAMLCGDYWESTVRIGAAGTPRGTIRIHRYSGKVSYDGPFLLKSTVSAESLERWANSLKKSRHQT
jgi:hypothetical protein